MPCFRLAISIEAGGFDGDRVVIRSKQPKPQGVCLWLVLVFRLQSEASGHDLIEVIGLADAGEGADSKGATQVVASRDGIDAEFTFYAAGCF